MQNFNKFCPFPWFFLNWNEVLEHWLDSEERYTGHLLALQGSNLWTDTAAGEIWNIYFSLMLLSQWNVGSLNWMIFISIMILFQHQQLWINWHSLSRRPIHAFPLKISLKYFIFPITHKQCVYRLMCVLSFTEKSHIRQHLEFIVYELEDSISIWDQKNLTVTLILLLLLRWLISYSSNIQPKWLLCFYLLTVTIVFRV